jgi:hypothetical protein
LAKLLFTRLCQETKPAKKVSLSRSLETIEILELEGYCQKQTMPLKKQGKFKVGVVPADGLGHLLGT